MSQIRLLEVESPEEIVDRACRGRDITARVCLFSGGDDSAAVAHRMRDHFDELVFIDTSVALPGVEEFVRDFADWLGKPLRVYRTPPESYDRIVLGGETVTGRTAPALGFPGPAQHTRCYADLKERQLDRMRTDLKARRHSRVLAITGIRRAESQRRAKREPVGVRRSVVFANPLIDWTSADLRDYRREHDLPQSPIAALLHRSGECNCGAFAAPGEREMLRSLFPTWFEARIGRLERLATEAGLEVCSWGSGRVAHDGRAQAGELCTDCQLSFESA